MSSSKRFRVDRAYVRHLLLTEWDPIGIYGVGPDDEYDSYVFDVCALAHRGADATSLAAHLREIAIERMGLSDAPHLRERCERTARMIIARRAELEDL